MHGMSALPQPEAAPPGLPPQPAADPGQAARAAAYEASILGAFGGKRGLTEAGLPSIVFIVVYTATRRLDASLWSAVAVAGAMALVRLMQKDKLQHALSGLVGVAVCAAFAKYTGQAKNFYLPGTLLNVGEAIVFCVSALVKWPIVGVVIGPITGEMTAWRDQPERLRAFTVSTWLLTGMFTLRVAIELPLYFGNQLTALGAAKVVLGYPLYLAVAFVCWRIIRKAPLPAQQAS